MKKALLLCLLVAGCGGAPPKPIGTATPSPVAVEVAQPRREDVHLELELPADVQPAREAKLYAKVNGYVAELLVDIGDSVQQGQLLARVESPEMARDVMAARSLAAKADAEALSFQAQAAAENRQSQASASEAARARSQAAAAAAQLAQARAELELRKSSYNRLKAVFDQDAGLIARQQLDEAWAQLKVARARVDGLQRNLEAARQEAEALQSRSSAEHERAGAAVAQGSGARELARSRMEEAGRAEDLLQYTLIRAPFSGKITRRHLDQGALVSSSTQPLLEVADVRRLTVSVRVPEMEAPRVKTGTPATLVVDALPKEKFSGRVSRTAGALSAQEGRTMLAEVDLSNGRGLLQPGMFGKLTLALDTHRSVLAVPSSAVLDEKGKLSVFLADAGKAKKQPIEAGYRNPVWTEVLKGVTGTDSVVVKGKERLVDGTPLSIEIR